MICEVYIPQLQLTQGNWVDVGVPAASYKEAAAQEINFPLSSKIIGFRVIKSSCDKGRKIKKTCCGG